MHIHHKHTSVGLMTCVTEKLSYVPGKSANLPQCQICIFLSPTQDDCLKTHMLVAIKPYTQEENINTCQYRNLRYSTKFYFRVVSAKIESIKFSFLSQLQLQWAPF